MIIEKDQFDQLPLTIQLGAIHLWATQIGDLSSDRQIFSLNDFFVELKEANRFMPVKILTYSATEIAEFVLRKRQAHHLYKERELMFG